MLAFTQLMPAAAAPLAGPAGCHGGNGGGGPSGHAVCQLYVRSSSPEVAHAVQLHAAEWLRDLSGGALLPGVMAPGPHASGAPKPPIDARVAGMQRSFLAAAAAGVAAAGGVAVVAGGGGTAAMGGGGPSGGLQGSKVGHPWLRSTASAEWQRLVMLQ